MNWRIISVIASILPFLIIMLQFNIKLEDVFAIGITPIVIASAFMIMRLVVQGIRFNYVVKTFLGNIDSMWKIILVRMGSEFVTFTTPMFVGGEIVRVAWLRKKNIVTSKASWVTILEIVVEVIAAGTLAIISGIFALLNGAIFIGILVLITCIPVLSLWSVLFFFSSKKIFKVPNIVSKLILKLSKKKGLAYIEKTNQWMENICIISKNNLRTKKTQKTFIVALLLSFVAWSLYGLSFMFIASSVNYDVRILDSILAVMASNAIGNVPITVGGSGISEASLWLYLESIGIYDFKLDENKLSWNIIIVWRIATYHVPMAITWFLLIKLALSKYTTTNKS